jgi:zinc protease
MILSLLVSLFINSPAHASEIKFEQDQSTPLVYLNLAFKGGSAHDPKGQSGISNFTGEMLLRGTKTMNKEQLDLALDQIGATIGVETRAELIVVRGSVLSTQLDKFLSLLEKILTEPSFTEGELKKLKTEIVSQILEERGRDQTLARQKWEEFYYGKHPYGRPVLGKLKEVERLTLPQVDSFYKRIFQEQNLLIVGTGDASEEVISRWSERLAQKLKNTAEGKIESIPPPALMTKRRIAIVDKPDRTQTQILVGQEGLLMNDPKYFPFHLGNQAFGGGSFSARLMVEIRVKRGWSYGAYAYQRHGTQPRTWQAYTFPANKDTPEAAVKLVEMITEWREKGITPTEFEFNQKSMVNSAGFMFNTPKKRVENILLERSLNLPNGFFRTYGPEISKQSVESVNAAVKEVLHPERLSVFILGTAKQLRPRLAAALKVKESEIEVIPFNRE